MQQYQNEVELHKHLVDDYKFRFSSKIQSDYHNQWGQKLIAQVDLPKDSAVLDFGCGTGVFLKELVESFDSVAGVDISPDMLAVAKENFPREDLQVASGEDLPWPDRNFNAVFIKGSLHHLADVSKGLSEIRRVLQPGGWLVLSEPCNDSWILKIIRFFWYRMSRKFSVHHKSFLSRELIDLISQAGFVVKKQERFGFLAFPIVGMVDFLPILRLLPGKRLLVGLDKILARIPFIKKGSWHIIIAAQKMHPPLTKGRTEEGSSRN